MSFEVEGRLHRVFPTESRSEKFQTREFVLEVADGNYPQLIKFQAVQDRCSMLDRFNEGDQVKVSFDLRGREWQGKYFTNLNAWRLGKPQASAAPTAGTSSPPASEPGSFPSAADEPGFGADNDDLPF